MPPSVEQLCATAKHLNLRWHANASDADDCIVPFENPEVTYLEHVCHELAHATLLGIRLGPMLAQRVEKAVHTLQHNEGYEAGEVNETETFAVVMGVFDRLGVAYDVCDMLEANAVQVSGLARPRQEIPGLWRRFRSSQRYLDAVDAVTATILKEVNGTPEPQRRLPVHQAEHGAVQQPEQPPEEGAALLPRGTP